MPSTSAPTPISQILRSAGNKKPIPDTRSKFRHYYPIIKQSMSLPALIKLHDLVAVLEKAQLLKRIIFVPGHLQRQISSVQAQAFIHR